MEQHGSHRPWLAVLLCAVVFAGCVSVKMTGAATVADLQAESNYNSVYSAQVSRLHADAAPMAPLGSDPGVCNKGGSKQGCFDVDALLIKDLQAMQSALGTVPVPPRYVAADQLLKAALASDIQGLSLRNQAISTDDDSVFQESQTVIGTATSDFQAAYAAFPTDDLPLPPP